MSMEYWLSVFLPYYDDSNCIVARRPKLFPVNNGQRKQLPGYVFVCCAHEESSFSHTNKYPFDIKRPTQKQKNRKIYLYSFEFNPHAILNGH